MVKKNLIFEEALAIKKGDDLRETRETSALQSRLYEESKQYFNSPPEKWPPIKINWDTSKQSQKFCLDGISQEYFEKLYPDGLCLGYVDLSTFDQCLCSYSRRIEGELWGVGFTDKLAFQIVYLAEGHPITPPLVKPTKDGQVVFQGGNHRYAIAKAIHEKTIPLYVEPAYKDEMSTILSIKWINRF